MIQSPRPAWRRSSKCANGNCIEVAKVGESYLIRDSSRPDEQPLTFLADEWRAFVAGVKDGEFE
ncbi:DUF397 domain-containing protein [Actinoplanes sp. NPDC051494]|uniref:DUF397 domain-containing protein n=1 Tax=Actinoplanes sp. NPDC051494 TaxID=3363907 RepID=UPI0037AB10B6